MRGKRFARFSRMYLPFAVAAVVAGFILAPGREPDPAVARGVAFGEWLAIANGVSRIDVDYRGSTSDPTDSHGDRIEFKLVGAESAHFVDGGNTVIRPIGGGPCDDEPDDATDVSDLSNCFALASVVSTAPETFRIEVHNLDQPDAGVLASEAEFVAAQALVPGFDSVASRGNRDGVAIQNTGTASATVVLSFVSGSGEQRKRAWSSLQPGASVIYDAGNDAGLPQFLGTVTIGSDQPVAALALHSYVETDGTVRRAIQRALPFEPEGTGRTFTLPYVANQLEGAYNTRFYITNTGTVPSCVKVTYHFVAGAGSVGPGGKLPLPHVGLPTAGCATSGLIVHPGHEQTFSPSGPGFELPAATVNTLMSVTVESTGGPVAVSVRAYTSDGTMKEASYEGFDIAEDTGTMVEVPLALKTLDGYYTHILFSNPGPVPVSVLVEYRGSEGATYAVTRELKPFGVDNHSTYSDDVVPDGFVGSAVVHATSPIAVVAFRAKKVNPGSELDDDLYTALNGIPTGLASNRAWFPFINRRVGKTGSLDGINSWISVSVPGGGPANLVIRALGSCSGPAHVYLTTVRIVDSFAFYQNAESDTGLGPAPPDCFRGAVEVTSDVPIVATASYINDLEEGDGEAVYNAITFPAPPVP